MTTEQPSESYVILVNALLRSLLCVSPWRMEAIYYQTHEGPPPLDAQWTRIVANDREGWVFVDRKAGRGEYRSSPPPGVDPKTIPTIEIPAEYRIGLRTMAAKLVDQVGGGSEYPHLDGLRDRLLAMGDGRFESTAVAEFVELCADPNRFPAALADYRSALLSGLCDTYYPGYYVGLMLLLLEAIQGVEVFALGGVIVSRAHPPHLMALLHPVLKGILDNDGPERIEAAAAKLDEEGKTHRSQARDAARDEAFYGHLFKACPFFYGAKMGFEFLANSVSERAERARLAARDHECEESLVYASSSLLNQFENFKFGWARWQEHCDRVAQARRDKGEGAAKLQATEYLEFTAFYPEHYREALLRGLEPPPATNGTAGGAELGQLCG